MKSSTKGVFLFVAYFAATFHAWAEDTAEGLAFFEKKIRPALAENCYKCHSAKAKKLKAGLYLDRKAGWVHGGESGPVVIPGKPDESRLLKAIRYKPAFRAFQELAGEGHLESQHRLAMMHRFGLGTETDFKKAVEWLFKAANRGFLDSQYHLGIM